MGVGLQRAVPVPKEAVAALGGVIQQHGEVTEHRIVRVGLGFLFNQAVQIFHDGEIRCFELANVCVPEDAELMIKLNDRLLQDGFLHIGQARQI